PSGKLQPGRMKTHHKSSSNCVAFSMVSIQFRRASCCYKSQFRYEIGRALMVSWTVGADGIAQKAYSAEEMHPEQNEIQPARGPRETSSLRPSNVISSSDSEHVFPPVQMQEQIAIKRGSGALTLLLLFFLVVPSFVQSASFNPPPQKSDSLDDSLRHSDGRPIPF